MYVSSSVSSLYNFRRSAIDRESILKRYAILYDNIIFNRRGCPIGNNDLVENLAECISLLISGKGDFNERKQLAKNKDFSDLFIDCWDIVDNAEQFESNIFQAIDKETANRIGSFSHEEIRCINGLAPDSYVYDIDDVKELSGNIYVEMGINNLLAEEKIDFLPSYSPIISKAICKESENVGLEAHTIFENDMLLPSFEDLTWDEIFELRSDKSIHNFRKVIYDLAFYSADFHTDLLGKYQQDLWSLVTDLKPDVGTSLLGGILSNLPMPTIVNPVGIVSAFKDVAEAKYIENRYGHIFFVQNVRQLKVNKALKRN
ncbi:hypothetical protein [Marinomonas sp. GJ51-6]|uniref:hypothetical protein n=1 Tax=Marinomonas sp. GJ51-6 TaxID=2992802 RepID=UPI00293490EE|nr:hypothetical protein [Marinomonas sp. GJ51-6]WOD07998.1 hypothetical protein ONZ50_02195 [Marinomonas sp. GJ51-6]